MKNRGPVIDTNAYYPAVIGRLSFMWYVRWYRSQGMDEANAYTMAYFQQNRHVGVLRTVKEALA